MPIADRAGASVRLVLGVTLALLCVPVLIDLAVSGPSRPFGYAAADTFYYLVVGRNIARHGLPSFDGTQPTNGFHPLWQLLVGGVHFVAEHLGAGAHVLLLTILVSLLLIALGTVLLGLSFSEGGRLSGAFVLSPFGAYGLMLAPFWIARLKTLAQESTEGPLPVYGTLWSYVNGMESGAVLLAFGASAFLFRAWQRAPSRRRALGFGLSLGALTLARLDHVFIALPLAAAFCLRAAARRRFAHDATLSCLGFAVPVALDVAVNLHWFGSAIPVSGALKSSFPFVTPTHIQIWLDTWAQGRKYNLWLLQTEASLLIPAGVALAYLAATLKIQALEAGALIQYRESARSQERFLVPVAVGVLLLAAYDVLFVVDGPGSWYLPVSTLFVTLAVVALAERRRERLGFLPRAAAFVCVTALGLAYFTQLARQPKYHARYASFFQEEAPALKRRMGPRPPRFVEVDDGIVSYALDVPAMSSGLALDPEGLDAKRAQRLYSLAYERGFKCVTTLVYAPAGEVTLASSPSDARRYAEARLGEDLSAYAFHVAYVAKHDALAIVCGERR